MQEHERACKLKPIVIVYSTFHGSRAFFLGWEMSSHVLGFAQQVVCLGQHVKVSVYAIFGNVGLPNRLSKPHF